MNKEKFIGSILKYIMQYNKSLTLQEQKTVMKRELIYGHNLLNPNAKNVGFQPL